MSTQVASRLLGITILLVICFASPCFGQTLKIRVLNDANNSAVENQRISISGITGNVGSPDEEREKLLGKHLKPDLRLVTDAKGEARFDLPNPAPAYFYVRLELSASHWDCTCLVRVSTEEVTTTGLKVRSAYDQRRPGKRPIKPDQDEILFSLRPLPLWVRVLWPLVKG